MIVVDTNLIAYAVVPGERTDAALSVLGADSAWVAPALWRFELRNALATTMRAGKLSLAGAVAALEQADRLVTDADFQDATEACLKLAAEGRVSAYDAEFVLVTERLGLPLVTADRKLAKAFPRTALSAEEFVRRS